jgi:hypothetical protein
MLKQNQPIVDAVIRPMSKVEEAALKAMSLQEVNNRPVHYDVL